MSLTFPPDRIGLITQGPRAGWYIHVMAWVIASRRGDLPRGAIRNWETWFAPGPAIDVVLEYDDYLSHEDEEALESFLLALEIEWLSGEAAQRVYEANFPQPLPSLTRRIRSWLPLAVGATARGGAAPRGASTPTASTRCRR